MSKMNVIKNIKGKECFEQEKQPIEPEFSVLFAKIRRSLDLTQKAFANELGICVKSVHKYECGETDIPVSIYYRACALYKEYTLHKACALDKEYFELFDVFYEVNEKDFVEMLGKIIKHYRQKSGMTQAILAEKIDVDKCIQRYESGKNKTTFRMSMLKQIGQELEVNLVDILVDIGKVDAETLNELRNLLGNNRDI